MFLDTWQQCLLDANIRGIRAILIRSPPLSAAYSFGVAIDDDHTSDRFSLYPLIWKFASADIDTLYRDRQTYWAPRLIQ